MAASVLSLLSGVNKLFIDPHYFQSLAQMQIVGGKDSHYFSKLKLTPSSRASSTEKIRIAFAIDQIDSLDEALFYHPVNGPIFAQDYGYNWLFSSQRFVNNLKAADDNPNIIGHFIHICSGGGEAWFLDKVAEAIRNCKKPTYAFIEMYCCSAAYYLASPCTVVKAYTRNDTIGSIGTMVSFWDLTQYWQSMGLTLVEAYATKSDMKNKKGRDLIEGRSEQFIREELDPLQEQFEASIRSSREALNNLPDDDPVFRGETFSADIALKKGMIDGIIDIEPAIAEAYELGITIKNNNNLLNDF